MKMTIENISIQLVKRGMFKTYPQAVEYVKAMRKYKRDCKKMGINITEHGGKLLGIYSLSTSPLKNKRCKCRAKDPTLICFYCYSMSMQNYKKGLKLALIENTKILTTAVIDLPPLPKCCKYFRIESFGDLINGIQVMNYEKYIKENTHVFFGWWTKNADIIAKTADFRKPNNCNLIQSACKVNFAEDIKYNFIDKVFTVYDKTSTACINCGARNCVGCKLCYTKNETVFLNESLK